MVVAEITLSQSLRRDRPAIPVFISPCRDPREVSLGKFSGHGLIHHCHGVAQLVAHSDPGPVTGRRRSEARVTLSRLGSDELGKMDHYGVCVIRVGSQSDGPQDGTLFWLHGAGFSRIVRAGYQVCACDGRGACQAVHDIQPL
jgi:hypothetical protein